MKALIQRVRHKTHIVCRGSQGEVSSQGEFEGPGLVVLLAWEESDPSETSILEARENWIVSRVEGLRVFPDDQQRMNLNLSSYLENSSGGGGGILWVPQFTLAAQLNSGFRPSFTGAMNPTRARERFEVFVDQQRQKSQRYQTLFGEFGSEMELSFTNWGPVTIPLSQ